ncbi:acetyl-CoA acetyltransferase [Marinobacter sp. ELB17]|uniref:thiolase family protein n=1 Tax=Marinobacter sp. ELB17 TaxID=270374 RepID=UPI0000F3B527|nr:acetyl-CoA acetyltransferase [Marinobacter sp. ELB17]EAZ98430.1 acetyl-CoA acetyltransferase [Marinobacter sp. ELB17]
MKLKVGVDAFADLPADRLSQISGINREQMDAFACRSHQRAREAQQRSFFIDEILPITVAEGESFAQDVYTRPGTGPAIIGFH